MCGITGIFDSKGIQADVLIRMSEVLRHRGPDDEGYFLIDQEYTKFEFRGKDTVPEIQFPHIENAFKHDNRFVLGMLHRRLSIIDLSSNGHQPKSYDQNSLYITFNGEIYNYQEIRDELIREGYTFESDNDTEVILASYSHWGEDCCSHFMGMWAFAIYDSREKKLFLSRDRFGIKPLYYYSVNSHFVFGSEIKALLQDPVVRKEINQDNLYQYLIHGKIVSQNETLFKGVLELEPGNNLIVDLAGHKITQYAYYDLATAVQQTDTTSNQDFIAEYRTRFQESVLMHMRSDVLVGSCLSGGLDSSALVFAGANLSNGNEFNTFTAAYHDAVIDESKFAKAVSASLPNVKEHYTWPVAKGYWNDLDKMIWHQDLPIASTSMFAQWEVMKLARQQGIKVLLDGQGADETLGGYSIFTGVYLLNLLKSMKFRKFFQENSLLKSHRSVNTFNELGRVAFQYLPAFLKASIHQKERLGASFINPDFRNNSKNSPHFVAVGKSYLEMSIQSTRYGMQDLLRYEDRNSMAFSIESRVPFLDHRLVEYSLALPDQLKIHNGWTKYILRKIVDQKLPDEVVWRKDKKGFVTPQKKWMTELRPQLTDYLSNASLPGILDRESIIKVLNQSELNASQVSEFWKVVSLIKWFEIFSFTE